jgi:long-chain acyl-CoA synthetase
LKITDQKKEMSKLQEENTLQPQIIEKHSKLWLLVKDKMPGAFIQTNFDFIKEWAAIHKFDIGSTNMLQ